MRNFYILALVLMAIALTMRSIDAGPIPSGSFSGMNSDESTAADSLSRNGKLTKKFTESGELQDVSSSKESDAHEQGPKIDSKSSHSEELKITTAEKNFIESNESHKSDGDSDLRTMEFLMKVFPEAEGEPAKLGSTETIDDIIISEREEDHTLHLTDSEEQVDLKAKSNPRKRDVSCTCDRKHVKRDIPDPDRSSCGCTRETSKDSTSTHDEYLELNNPYNKRDKRHVQHKRYGKTALEQALELYAEKKLRLLADEKGNNEWARLSSMESDALTHPDVEIREPGKLVDPMRQKFEETNAKAMAELDLMPLNSDSMEDYAQGCEETELNSDELNETVYKDRKRRDLVEEAEVTKANDGWEGSKEAESATETIEQLMVSAERLAEDDANEDDEDGMDQDNEEANNDTRAKRAAVSSESQESKEKNIEEKQADSAESAEKLKTKRAAKFEENELGEKMNDAEFGKETETERLATNVESKESDENTVTEIVESLDFAGKSLSEDDIESAESEEEKELIKEMHQDSSTEADTKPKNKRSAKDSGSNESGENKIDTKKNKNNSSSSESEESKEKQATSKQKKAKSAEIMNEEESDANIDIRIADTNEGVEVTDIKAD